MAVLARWRESGGGGADRLRKPQAQRSSETVESGVSSCICPLWWKVGVRVNSGSMAWRASNLHSGASISPRIQRYLCGVKGTSMSIRPVKRLIKSKPTLEGAGVHLRRAFGFGSTNEFDPFLLLDDFRNDVPEDY